MKTGLMGGVFAGGMGGWLVWVRWAPHRFSSWYVGPGLFATVLPTFVVVSRMQLAQQYRGNGRFLSAASFSRRETMVGGSLTRASALHVGLGVGGAAIASGSRARPTHSCDGCVCDLGAVGASSIFGWVRGAGAFAAVLQTFVVVSRMQLALQYRGNSHFLSAASFSRHKAMVGGALARASALPVGLGVGGATIVPGSCARPSHSWISRLLTSSSSLGISSLFCRATQCM
jgi:hypothetical protein